MMRVWKNILLWGGRYKMDSYPRLAKELGALDACLQASNAVSSVAEGGKSMRDYKALLLELIRKEKCALLSGAETFKTRGTATLIPRKRLFNSRLAMASLTGRKTQEKPGKAI